MRKRIVAWVLAAVGAAAALAGAKEAPVLERYRGFAMNVSGPGPSSTTVEVAIQRWSTDEERSGLLSVLAERGSRALTEALHDQEPTGWIRTTNRLAYDLRYAREIQQGDQRVLVLATDRPILMVEAMGGTRTQDYNVTLVRLDLDAEGNGEGILIPGAELVLDLQANELTIEQHGVDAVRLTSVRRSR
jgi:hypothetical protein